MSLKEKGFLIVLLIVLALTVFFVVPDIKRDREKYTLLTYVESSENMVPNDKNTQAVTIKSRKRNKTLLESEEFKAKADIRSTYFENQGSVPPQSKSEKDSKTQCVWGKVDDNLQFMVYSYSGGNTNGVGKVSNGNMSTGIASKVTFVGMVDENREIRPRQRVDGGEGPGEPPVPVGDAAWLLSLATILYVFVKYRNNTK